MDSAFISWIYVLCKRPVKLCDWGVFILFSINHKTRLALQTWGVLTYLGMVERFRGGDPRF